MSNIIQRLIKNEPLTYKELDENFLYKELWRSNFTYKQDMVVLYNEGQGYFFYKAKSETNKSTFIPNDWDRIGSDVGIVGADGLRGSQWIINGVLPSDGTIRENDFKLESNGDVLYYDGTTFINTNININGQDGVNGIDGSDGQRGSEWVEGSNLPSDGVLRIGDSRVEPNGDISIYDGTSFVVTSVSIKGVKGDQGDASTVPGIRGSQWVEGSNLPSDGVLRIGDSRVEPNGDISIYDGTSFVTTSINIKGINGDQGLKGDTHYATSLTSFSLDNITPIVINTSPNVNNDGYRCAYIEGMYVRIVDNNDPNNYQISRVNTYDELTGDLTINTPEIFNGSTISNNDWSIVSTSKPIIFDESLIQETDYDFIVDNTNPIYYDSMNEFTITDGIKILVLNSDAVTTTISTNVIIDIHNSISIDIDNTITSDFNVVINVHKNVTTFLSLYMINNTSSYCNINIESFNSAYLYSLSYIMFISSNNTKLMTINSNIVIKGSPFSSQLHNTNIYGKIHSEVSTPALINNHNVNVYGDIQVDGTSSTLATGCSYANVYGDIICDYTMFASSNNIKVYGNMLALSSSGILFASCSNVNVYGECEGSIQGCSNVIINGNYKISQYCNATNIVINGNVQESTFTPNIVLFGGCNYVNINGNIDGYSIFASSNNINVIGNIIATSYVAGAVDYINISGNINSTYNGYMFSGCNYTNIKGDINTSSIIYNGGSNFKIMGNISSDFIGSNVLFGGVIGINIFGNISSNEGVLGGCNNVYIYGDISSTNNTYDVILSNCDNIHINGDITSAKNVMESTDNSTFIGNITASDGHAIESCTSVNILGNITSSNYITITNCSELIVTGTVESLTTHNTLVSVNNSTFNGNMKNFGNTISTIDFISNSRINGDIEGVENSNNVRVYGANSGNDINNTSVVII